MNNNQKQIEVENVLLCDIRMYQKKVDIISIMAHERFYVRAKKGAYKKKPLKKVIFQKKK